MAFSIYILRHPDSKEVVYVGCTSNPDTRYKQHCYNFLRKFGFSPEFEIIDTIDDYDTALDKEWELIQEHKETVASFQHTKFPMPGRLPKSHYDVQVKKAVVLATEQKRFYQFYRFKDVMENYKVTRTTLYRLMKERGIDPYMIGKRSPRLREDQIEKLFNTVNQ